MKAWILADAANGYVWNWKLYTGKEDVPASNLGLAHRVVLDLLDDDRLRNKGYRVFTDNFYSSPALFQDLLEEGFEACGTLRSNRKGIPEDVKAARLRKGESHFSKDDSLRYMKWRDKREVMMLSTFHDDTFIEKRQRTRLATDRVEMIEKPAVVEEYNQHMGGVDKGKCNKCTYTYACINLPNIFTSADQMVLYYGFAHRSIKWWKRVFFHLLDTAIVNAHILYNASSELKLTQNSDEQLQRDCWMGMRPLKSVAVLKILAFHFGSKGDPFLSRYQTEVVQTAKSAVTGQQAIDTKVPL